MTKKALRVAGGVAGMVILSATGTTWAAEPRSVPVPASGVGLGWGWQSDRELALPSICIEFERGEDLAQTARLTIKEVSDRSELMDELDISASVAVDAIVGSASASASFAKSVEMKQTASTFLLRAEIDDGLIFTAPPTAGGPMRIAPPPISSSIPIAPKSAGIGDWLGGLFGRNSAPSPVLPSASDASQQLIGAVRLTARARELLTANKLQEFLKQCGDSFVWGIRGGAALSAAITFQTRSLREKNEISTEMSGSYSFVRGTGKFKKGHDASEVAENYTLTAVQIGGSKGAIPGSREKLLEKLDSLAGEAAARPKPVGLLVVSYHELPDWPMDPLWPEPSPRDLLFASYWRYSTLYENIEQVLGNQAGYMLNRGVSVASLRSLQDEVNAIRRRIENAARAVQSFERQQGLSADYVAARELEPILRREITAPTENDNGGRSDDGGEAEPDALPASKPVARMLAAVADAEHAMAPVEELLTRMPLPYADPTKEAENKLSESEMQRAIVEYYIGRAAKRRCAISATTPGCLSNAEIDGFVLQVPTGPKDRTRHGNPVGYATGRQFGDVALYGVLDSRLIRVSIHYDSIGIVGLEFTYKTPDNREVPIGSGAPPEGATTKTLELAEDELLTQASGLWFPLNYSSIDARHISELAFATSKGRSFVHGGRFAADPYRNSSKTFSYQARDGEELFAFSGRLHPLTVYSWPQTNLLGVLEPIFRRTVK